MSRFDILRSLVRGAGDRARERLGELAPVSAARRVLTDLKHRRVLIKDEHLTAGFARVPGIESIGVTAQGGSIRVDAMFDNGEHVAVSFTITGARFAPQGAKELAIEVEPAELAQRPKVRDLASALAGLVAKGLWGVVVNDDERLFGAIPSVARDGTLRVDLRDVPAVRALGEKGRIAMVIEALIPKQFGAEDGALIIELDLPTPFAP